MEKIKLGKFIDVQSQLRDNLKQELYSPNCPVEINNLTTAIWVSLCDSLNRSIYWTHKEIFDIDRKF